VREVAGFAGLVVYSPEGGNNRHPFVKTTMQGQIQPQQ
jgi:hypothetical protein